MLSSCHKEFKKTVRAFFLILPVFIITLTCAENQIRRPNLDSELIDRV